MIIQCEQCRTKFKLDDSRVADKSIKVRCARCRHVFTVAGMQGVPKDPASLQQIAPVFQIEEDLGFTAAPAHESLPSFEPDTHPDDDSFDHSSLLDTFSFAEDEEPAAPESAHSAGNDYNLSLSSTDSAVTHDQKETRTDSASIDFGAIDFSQESGDAGSPAAQALALDFEEHSVKQGQAVISPKEEFSGLDFSKDDMFGDVVSTPPEETTSESISFEVGMDGFTDSMGVESSAASQGASFDAEHPAAENPFSLDDVDFGDELTSVAVQQFSPEELKPSQDLLFAPLATTETKPALDSAAVPLEKTAAPSVEEEIPPASIISRRKESPRSSRWLALIGILIVGLVGFYGYWVYMSMTAVNSKTTQETGRITVRSVVASFVENKQTGPLLVISGEAVNEYGKPRAAIKIKGIVFGPDGKEVSSKSAFCGNPLSREQLETMTIDKIEAAMSNQFGDSLSNMEVAPGAAIPFAVVIPKPPAGATDYGVEPAGSTVAAGKEK